jgi:hypothetical protein
MALVLLVRLLIPIFREKEPVSEATDDYSKKSGHQNLTETVQAKRLEEEEERVRKAELMLNDKEFTGRINIPSDISLIETESCLLIKGSVESIASICDELAVMEQLPEGYCLMLGEWRLFVLDDMAQSDRELKTVVMPRDHWLFMSCKLRDSILGYDVHPYNYVYEPFTFKQVLEYGIGVEAIDINNQNELD